MGETAGKVRPIADRVLIVGAGIAGLSAAIALGQAGVDVTLIEIKDEASSDGTGIQQPSNAIRALASVGVVDEIIEAGWHWNEMSFHDKDGTELAHVAHGISLPPYPAGNGILRPRLHAILVAAALDAGVDLRTGTTFNAIQQDRDGATVELSDGTTETFDLVVGADGIRSRVRQATFGPEPRPTPTGEVCWRCNVPKLPHVDYISIFATIGARAGVIPIGADLMYIFLIEALRPGEEHLPLEGLNEVFRERLADWGGAIGEVRDTLLTDPGAQVVYRPLETLMLAPTWYRDHVVVIGDAAHAMTPHLGQGAAQAIEDGVVLARMLTAGHASLDEALAAFMRRRLERCRVVLDSSLQIGRWELERATDADYVGVQRRVSEMTEAPFLDGEAVTLTS